MGYLYRPKLKSGRRSEMWWAKYYVNGRPVRESTGVAADTETPPAEARRFLKTREGRAATGQPILPRADRVRYEEIAADLRRHYDATGARDLAEYDRRVAHLTRVFTGRRVASLGQTDADTYVLHRQGQGVVGSTIRRELGTLTKMLRLAYRNGKLLRLPLLDKPKEGPPREGFFERDQYEAVRRRLPDDLKVAVTIAYTYGWRTQSEVLPLERRQLDLEAGTLRLDPGSTKNDEGRLVYLTPECAALLAGQVARVETLQRRLGRIVPALFPHLGQGVRAGNPRGAGVPERVAMKVTGHKTRAVFDRYHIVSPGDLREVARKLAGTFTGTFTPGAVHSPAQVSDLPRTGG